MSDTVSGVPRLAWRLAIVAAVAFIFGPLGAHFGLTRAMTGFGLFGLGGILGIVSLVLGIIGILRHGGEARSTAVRGAILGGIVAAAFLFAGSNARGLPRINDITTDTQRPPSFVFALKLPENEGRDMTYPGPSFAEQQRKAYPDIAPLILPVPPAEAYAKVKGAASGMPNWTITRDDAEAFAIEGIETTNLFRFQDDFVIEVRPEMAGSVVQMRSKSRNGQGDIGANANRIRAFFAKVKSS